MYIFLVFFLPGPPGLRMIRFAILILFIGFDDGFNQPVTYYVLFIKFYVGYPINITKDPCGLLQATSLILGKIYLS